MSKIIIKKNICYIKEEDDINFVRLLDNELSFRVLGAEHTKAFKTGYYVNNEFVKWDGMHRILTSSLTFPRGLLERVKKLYDQYGKSVEIIEDNIEISPINSMDLLPKLKEVNKYPRQYQFDVLEAVKNKDCGIIRAATGSGKTIMALLMTAYFGKKTVIYVIGKDLLHQTHKFFSSIFDEPIGIIGDGLCDIHDINIASVWTVGQVFGMKKNAIIVDGSPDGEKLLKAEKYNDIKDLVMSAKVALYDECHYCSAETFQTISKNTNPEHVYGMSASPYRDDNADLLIEAIFGGQIVDIPASRLIREGFLVKPIIKFLDVPKYHEPLKKSYQTVYSKYIIDNPVRNEKVVTGAIKLVEQGFQPLVSYTRIKHGKLLYKEISKHMPCILLSGKDSSKVREEAKDKLENGEINCILASTIFDIGVDLPSLSGLIVAGAGKSSVRSLQRIGRVLRPFENKKIAAVIDFHDRAHFLTKHAKARRKIYEIEEEFDVIWKGRR